MKLYTTLLIDIPAIFSQQKSFSIKKYVKENGKSLYKTVEISSSNEKLIFQAQLLVSFILELQHRDGKNRFVNIPSTNLKKLLGNNYLSVVQLLVNLQLLKLNNKFQFSKERSFSKSYCIGDFFFSKEIKEIEVVPLLDDVQNDGLKGCTIAQACSKENTPPSSYPRIGTTTLLNYLNSTIRDFADKHVGVQPRIRVSNVCGRIFTPVTQMKKGLRKEIKDAEGNPFITVDFSTSHLQHLIRLMTSTDANVDPDELERFTIAVLNGDFYNSLNNNKSRSDNKRYTNCWLASSYSNWVGVKYLKGLYPSINSFIDTFNNGTRNKLPNALMRSESFLLNNTILEYIAEHNPDLTAYGIHDAVMIEPKGLKLLLELIANKGTEYFGFKPKFKIDDIPPVLEPNNKPVQVQNKLHKPKTNFTMNTEKDKEPVAAPVLVTTNAPVLETRKEKYARLFFEDFEKSYNDFHVEHPKMKKRRMKGKAERLPVPAKQFNISIPSTDVYSSVDVALMQTRSRAEFMSVLERITDKQHNLINKHLTK